MKSKRLILLLTLIGTLLCTTALWLFKFRNLLTASPKNIVLISIDTCRADHLSCYGYDSQTTPNIDALAREGILFENVYTPVPLTLPAHCSMLTGTLPPYHGVHDNYESQLGESQVTLAEIAKSKGLATGAIIGATILSREFGISQGFDTYHEHFDQSYQVTETISERKGDEVSRYAVQWLEEHTDTPFFLFIHYYDAHDPYNPPHPFCDPFADNLYAGEIAYVDSCIGKVVDKLKLLNLYHSTLLIITGDHGEMLGEHGEQKHGYFIYQAALKVPLLFKMPGRGRPLRITEAVSLTDIVPTVCALLDTPIPSHAEGRNLFEIFKSKKSSKKERPLYCESLYPTKYKANSLLGVIEADFKYIQTTRPELYNIAQDPQESVNLADKEPQRARILQDHLKQILDEQLRQNPPEMEFRMSEKQRKAIESLGYIGGTINKDFTFDQNKDDPKDVLDIHNEFEKVIPLFFNRQFEEVKKICFALIDKRPQLYQPYAAIADIARQEGDFKTAEVYLREAVKLDPNQCTLQNDLGVVLGNQGKLDEAAECFLNSLQINPNQSKTQCNLGNLLLMQDKYDQGIIHLEKALELDPDSPLARYHLIETFLKIQKISQAREHYTEYTKRNAEDAALLIEFSRAYTSEREFDQAIETAQKALAIDPHSPGANQALAIAFVRKGNRTQAILFFEKTLQLEPNLPDPYNDLGILYSQIGNLSKAVHYWKQGLQRRPAWPQVLNNLAWIMATEDTFKNPEEAIRLGLQACQLTDFKNPFFLDTLAAAYASAGKFDEAVVTAQQALRLAQAEGQKQLIDEIQKHIELYQNQ